MSKVDPETSALKEQLTDALAEIDSLQAARAESERLSARLRETALKYREARLTAAPHIPADLVTGEEMEEIDEQLTAAERVVSEMQERMEKERRQESPPIPAGSPVRRAPDYSGLPATEKIKLGLQHLSD